MFLKSLELNGFKSFANKTVLEFPKGITAIVGPNGSGKSNIIDSIRWLLGEREAKNLRSAKAEDLIFSGAPNCPRTSIAQAGLLFDNSFGFFPIDFKEVFVSRRVGRDGVSQYFLNKAEIKLKEAIDFFSRSRLGTKGLAIINQGEADLFVKASAEERKLMIEEILGLKEYQIKKIEAERKLKNTIFNLEKVKAIVEEIIPRLKMLKRQTNKWEKRIEFQKELEEIENNYFSYKLNEIKKRSAEIEPTIDFFKNQIGEKNQELKFLEQNIKTENNTQSFDHSVLKEIKKTRQDLLAEKFQVQRELGKLDAKLEFLSSTPENSGKIFKNEDLIELINWTKQTLKQSFIEENFENFKKIIKEIFVKIDKFLAFDAKDEFPESKELEKLTEIKNNLELKFNHIEAGLEKTEKQEIGIASNLEEFNKKFQKAYESIEVKRKELRELEEESNKIILDKEKLNLKFQELEDQLRQIGKKTTDFKFIEIQTPPNIEIELPYIEKKMFKLRNELAAIGEIDEVLVKEAREVEIHYNFLNNQSQDLAKAIIDLKNLIKELNEKIHFEFNHSFKLINEEFNKFFKLMFGGGFASLKIKNSRWQSHRGSSMESGQKSSGYARSRIARNIKNVEDDIVLSDKDKELDDDDEKENEEILTGIEINLNLPKKRITGLDTLSGGEKSLVSIAALFALISISPPPFLVLDEIDAALDENNSGKFANLIKEFSNKTQFIIVTHNRAVMETANVLYGITTNENGTSKVLSLKLE